MKRPKAVVLSCRRLRLAVITTSCTKVLSWTLLPASRPSELQTGLPRLDLQEMASQAAALWLDRLLPGGFLLVYGALINLQPSCDAKKRQREA